MKLLLIFFARNNYLVIEKVPDGKMEFCWFCIFLNENIFLLKSFDNARKEHFTEKLKKTPDVTFWLNPSSHPEHSRFLRKSHFSISYHFKESCDDPH